MGVTWARSFEGDQLVLVFPVLHVELIGVDGLVGCERTHASVLARKGFGVDGAEEFLVVGEPGQNARVVKLDVASDAGGAGKQSS